MPEFRKALSEQEKAKFLEDFKLILHRAVFDPQPGLEPKDVSNKIRESRNKGVDLNKLDVASRKELQTIFNRLDPDVKEYLRNKYPKLVPNALAQAY